MREPNGVLVMTTCKCREHGTNLVMTRKWFDETLQGKIAQGARQERYRVVELLKGLRFTFIDGVQRIDLSKDDVVALVRGEEND
jgi:hypothetical protein